MEHPNTTCEVTVDTDQRWAEIQAKVSEIAYRDEPPSELESMLCGAVVRARDLKRELALVWNDRDKFEKQRADWKAAHDGLVERGGARVGRFQPPAGWALVPIEPDANMVEAGYPTRTLTQSDATYLSGEARRVYAAMLNAAPFYIPPVEQSNGQEQDCAKFDPKYCRWPGCTDSAPKMERPTWPRVTACGSLDDPGVVLTFPDGAAAVYVCIATSMAAELWSRINERDNAPKVQRRMLCVACMGCGWCDDPPSSCDACNGTGKVLAPPLDRQSGVQQQEKP